MLGHDVHWCKASQTATGKIQRYRLRERLWKQAESDLEGRTSDGAGQG